MEILTLQEKSLIRLSQDFTTLREVLDLCQSSTHIGNICERSKAFWLYILPRVGYKRIALAFKPLDNHYWSKLIEGLIDGRFYKYTGIINDVDYNGIHKVVEYNDMYKPIDIPNEIDDDNYTFMLPVQGISLTSGTVCWGLDVTFIDDGTNFSDNYHMLSSNNIKEDTMRLLDLLSNIYREKLEKFISLHPNQSYAIAFEDDFDTLISPTNFNGQYINGYPKSYNTKQYIPTMNQQTIPSENNLRDLFRENFDFLIAPSWLNMNCYIHFNLVEPHVFIRSVFQSFNAYRFKMY
jgi:hypothetical protein